MLFGSNHPMLSPSMCLADVPALGLDDEASRLFLHDNARAGVWARAMTVIYETVHGSRAYGLAREGSDTDIKGVIVGPAAWYFGFAASPEQVDLGPDHVRYEIRKLFRLLASGNPTLIELLWTRPEHHLTMTPAGERLMEARERFLSTQVADTFGGYALSQLKRIKGHRAWLLDPPTAQPKRSRLRDCRTSPCSARTSSERPRRCSTRPDATGLDDLSPNFLDVLDRERRYRTAKAQWKQYQGWLTNRNPKRAALEARFGYDTKHAMHLVRLQRMAVEILQTGAVPVHREDRDELLAIRDGAWSYDELIAQSDALAQGIVAARASSHLPARPDRDALNALCVSLVQEVLS